MHKKNVQLGYGEIATVLSLLDDELDRTDATNLERKAQLHLVRVAITDAISAGPHECGEAQYILNPPGGV